MPEHRSGNPDVPPQRLTLQQLGELLGFLPAGISDAELDHVRLRGGDILFEEGDEADSLYVLIAGVAGVRVRHEDGSLSDIDRLAPGAIVGEMALMGAGTRTATVYAINDVELLRIGHTSYQAMITGSSQAEQVLGRGFDARWQRIQLARILKDLLGEIDAMTLQLLQDELDWVHLSNGDVLFSQGDVADGLYVVVNGRLRVAAMLPQGEPQTIGDVCPGETVGEFALIADAPRSATVRAVRESNVVRMTRATFERLARSNPRLMVRLTEIIVTRRQQSLVRRPGPPSFSFVLVPAGPSVDLAVFAGELTEAMTVADSVALLDARRFDAQFGQEGASLADPDDPIDGAVSAWLDELETRTQFIVYVADEGPTSWTRRCVDHADRVLVIADPAADPRPGPTEEMLSRREVPLRTDLVLWHPPETTRPVGTAAWLDGRTVKAHYHVKQGAESHMARLARRLTGQATVLVLSGGGALAYSELGVFRALLELGIPIDYVGGTSMGSIVSGGIAAGYRYEEMCDMARWTAELGVIDKTLPLASLAASKNVTKITQHAFGEFAIEDLWLPWFCVSTNMSSGEAVVHTRGLMWRAVRASTSIPGVFLPLVEEGNVLIDGGVMDNFPVEIMSRLSDAGRIIGVNVVSHKERLRSFDYDASLSGWKLLFNRLNPFAKRMRAPSMIQTLLRATEINGLRESRRQQALADMVIVPDVQGFRFTDYDRWEGLAQRGYEAALEPLRALDGQDVPAKD